MKKKTQTHTHKKKNESSAETSAASGNFVRRRTRRRKRSSTIIEGTILRFYNDKVRPSTKSSRVDATIQSPSGSTRTPLGNTANILRHVRHDDDPAGNMSTSSTQTTRGDDVTEVIRYQSIRRLASTSHSDSRKPQPTEHRNDIDLANRNDDEVFTSSPNNSSDPEKKTLESNIVQRRPSSEGGSHADKEN